MMSSVTSKSILSIIPSASPYLFFRNDRPEVVAEQDLVALHQALMAYVQTEFVEGSAELGLSCKSLRIAYGLCFADILLSDF